MAPCYTTDKSQAERCLKACVDRTTITEVWLGDRPPVQTS
jgi:hypothetical protein